MAVTTKAKACSKCGEIKPLEDFHRHKQLKDGRNSSCADCKNKSAAGYYQRWTPEQRESHRRRVYAHRYGLTTEQYDAMYTGTETCSICDRKDAARGRLSVDHCHETGRVRGLLCTNCNAALGMLGDNLGRLERAVQYLRGAESSRS